MLYLTSDLHLDHKFAYDIRGFCPSVIRDAMKAAVRTAVRDITHQEIFEEGGVELLKIQS